MSGKLLPGDLTGPDGSMPVHAPYYAKPPFHFRQVRAMLVSYATDAAAAAAILPADLALPLQPNGSAGAVFMLLDYPESPLGAYREAILGLPCVHGGRGPYLFVAFIMVDAALPMVVGREIWGFPKKLAEIELARDAKLVSGSVEHPAGVRLATASVRTQQEIEPQGGFEGSIVLRVLPSAERGASPSVAELVEVPSAGLEVHEVWTGAADLSLDAESDADPWHRLPVRSVQGAIFQRFDFTMPHGRVLRTY